MQESVNGNVAETCNSMFPLCLRKSGPVPLYTQQRKREKTSRTGNGNTGYPSCFRNGLTCFCHVSVYGFLQFRPVSPVEFTSLKICDASMMSSERAPEELDEVNPRTRPRRPNTTLDSDGVRNERIRSLKNTRKGHIANVTAKVNEVIELLSDERNL